MDFGEEYLGAGNVNLVVHADEAHVAAGPSTVLSTFYYLLESSVRYLSSAPQTIAAGTPADYLAESGRRRVRDLLDRYGDAALAASAQQLESLTPRQQERLRKLSGR